MSLQQPCPKALAIMNRQINRRCRFIVHPIIVHPIIVHPIIVHPIIAHPIIAPTADLSAPTPSLRAHTSNYFIHPAKARGLTGVLKSKSVEQ